MSQAALSSRKFDARPDTMDFRDRPYAPSLVEVPPAVELDRYRRFGAPVLDQGTEGACTGFGLATVANYLLRTRESDPDVTRVSPRMLYEMARRYDEWEGEAYSGSSARGAVKGWHKHGVCASDEWPYIPGSGQEELTPDRIADAASRPLGAYYRVNHKDLVSVHAALAEVGIVYATGIVHQNWDKVNKKTGVIPPRTRNTDLLGGHAFAVVAYDHRGFWIQNSWGEDWGHEGFALLTYEDWLTTATDAWVVRLGAPVTIGSTSESIEDFTSERQPHSYTFHEMRPHIVALGNDGRLATTGSYATTQSDIGNIIDNFERTTETWQKPRLVLYAHGGLVSASSAVAQAARMRSQFLRSKIYPVFFVWNSDWYSTLENLIEDTYRRWLDESPATGPLDFLADRVDDLIERIARSTFVARSGWDEIKENAVRASSLVSGGARLMANAVAESRKRRDFELHVVGHSAGGILHAALCQYLGTGQSTTGPVRGAGLGMTIDSATLWAPACTMDLFDDTYAGLLRRGKLKELSLMLLRDEAERDDSAGPYRKSILYLVSNALEDEHRIPFFSPEGEPILGMEKFQRDHDALQALRERKLLDVLICPTRDGSRVSVQDRSRASTHVAFSSDSDTLRATIARITGSSARVAAPMPTDAVKGLEKQRAKSK